MDIGVGTPATIPGVPGSHVLDWARRADGAAWSTLAVIDRVAYPNLEPLATLAACAGATRRIRLTTTVLVVPLRNAGMLAKQAATIDQLSAGRLTLGLGIGARETDYRAADAGVAYDERATHYEHQLDLMRRIWRGEPPQEDLDPVGPPPAQPGGPEVLIGGYSEAAAARVGRFGDGFIAGPLSPRKAREFYEAALASWQRQGREGRPRFVTCRYVALGDETDRERGRDHLRHYYRFAGQERAEQAAQGMLDSAAQIEDWVGACAEVGVDEVIVWPAVPELELLDRLEEVVGGRAD